MINDSNRDIMVEEFNKIIRMRKRKYETIITTPQKVRKSFRDSQMVGDETLDELQLMNEPITSCNPSPNPNPKKKQCIQLDSTRGLDNLERDLNLDGLLKDDGSIDGEELLDLLEDDDNLLPGEHTVNPVPDTPLPSFPVQPLSKEEEEALELDDLLLLPTFEEKPIIPIPPPRVSRPRDFNAKWKVGIVHGRPLPHKYYKTKSSTAPEKYNVEHEWILRGIELDKYAGRVYSFPCDDQASPPFPSLPYEEYFTAIIERHKELKKTHLKDKYVLNNMYQEFSGTQWQGFFNVTKKRIKNLKGTVQFRQMLSKPGIKFYRIHCKKENKTYEYEDLDTFLKELTDKCLEGEKTLSSYHKNSIRKGYYHRKVYSTLDLFDYIYPTDLEATKKERYLRIRNPFHFKEKLSIEVC